MGVGRDRASLDAAERVGAIDRGETDLLAAAAEADLIVICTPISRIARDASAALAVADRDCVITDVGSVKASIVEEVEGSSAAGGRFVGSHPIAGSEREGIANARSDLFAGRPAAITPTDRTDPGVLDRVLEFWRRLGARTLVMSPSEHDRLAAFISHLPHIVAGALASAAPEAALPLAGASFRDGVRVASSPVELWTEIFLANGAKILESLAEFRSRLDQLSRAIENQDPEGIRRWWLAAQNQTGRNGLLFKSDPFG